MLLTGLAQHLFPGLSLRLIHTLQNCLGLLSGALTLRYLGLWMGPAAEDRVVQLTIRFGALALVVLAGTMATLTLLSPAERWHELLLITACINAVAVLLPAVASSRAIVLGDRLARGILAATVLLALMVAGLYARGLGISGLGNAVWLLTALCTVTFFMLGTYLGIRRDRVNRRLERLAGLAQGDDPATGLPKGSVLLSKVDDALWRAARKNQECTVICLHLRNLYELADIAGHNADQQILSAMRARMRRAVGFRHLIGLYHPRCFVIIVSAAAHNILAERTMQRLRHMMSKPLAVSALDGTSHHFIPRFGIGSLTVTAGHTDPATILDEAERLSRDSDGAAANRATLDIALP
jgi:diguanylate cyclase (GGDEF)-like protein